MRNLRFVLPAIVLVAMVGCNSIPEGYTEDQWNLLKAQSPHTASMLEWINAKAERREVRRLLMEFEQRNGRQIISAEHILCEAAEDSIHRNIRFRDVAAEHLQRYSQKSQALEECLKQLDLV